MQTIACLVAVALAAPAAAAPVSVQTGTGIVTRVPYAELKTFAGRARFLAAVEASADRLCRDVHPLRLREACETDVVARVEAGTIRPVRQALQRAAAERDEVAFAAR